MAERMAPDEPELEYGLPATETQQAIFNGALLGWERDLVPVEE
ncbi:MAG: hypothetical protein ACJ758_03370 [Actinomycetota bacterium]